MTSLPEFELAGGHMAVDADEAWIVRARQGDAAAWEYLVRRYQQPVFRLAYLILGDAGDAEEVAQDVFVRAYLSLARYDKTRPLAPWLLQICRNLARNRRRSLGRYWAAVQRWRQANPDTAVLPDDRQEAQLLWQAVKKLRPSAQEIIYLRYFLALPEAETAAALNIKAGTVKSRLHRALKQLQQVIEHDFPELVLNNG